MTIQTGTAKKDTFNFVPGDTAIDGAAGTDTLVFAQTAADLTTTTVSNVEILKAGSVAATTFTVDQADLVTTGGSVIGNAGTDILTVTGTAFDLRSTVLTSVEILKAATTSNTAFFLDQADLAKGGQVVGSTSGGDALTVTGPSLDLTSTTLDKIDGLVAGKSTATTFTIDAADLAVLSSVTGNSGSDSLIVKSATVDLTAVALSSLEILKAGVSTATTFSLDETDLASGGSVIGAAGSDSLVVKGTAFDLSETTLTSVERLAAGSTSSTTFTIDQADLAKGGSIVGSTSNGDAVTIDGTNLDLTSTVLTDIEGLTAGSKLATTFTIDALDFSGLTSVTGGAANDSLVLKGTAFDVTSVSLTSVETLKAGLAIATTFTVNDPTDYSAIIGAAGKDMLIAKTTDFNLTSTVLTSIETLQAGSTGSTTFTVDQADLASGGSVIGVAGKSDILETTGTILNLLSETLTSVEVLKAIGTAAVTFTIDLTDLAIGASVIGMTGKDDTLVVNGTTFDLTSSNLTSVEILKAGKVTTTFTLDKADLVSGGSIMGSTGTDSLIIKGTDFDLRSTVLSSVERLVADTTNATTFTLDQNDLVAKGSVIGHSTATDIIVTGGTALDLSGSILTSIDALKAGTSGDTVFTVNKLELSSLAIAGSAGEDTLQMAGTLFDLTSTTLASIENLGAALTTATSFKVDLADLAAGGSVNGNKGADTLTILGTDFNLASTALSSIEKLVASSSNPTTFSVNQTDLAGGGSILGGIGSDTLKAVDTALDLSSTALTSIEKLTAGSTGSTTFTVDQADLGNNVLVTGVTGKNDTLVATGTSLNLTSATLNSIEILASSNAKGTAFTLDTADLAGVGSIIGGTGTGDSLIVLNSIIDLTAKAVSGVETLKAGLKIATTLIVDQADLATGGSVIGTGGTDTLQSGGTELNLSNTALTSIEILQAGTTSSTTFTVDQADLAKNGSIVGNAATSDKLDAAGTALDLTSTTLTSIDILATVNSLGTTFTVRADELAGLVSIAGGSGSDTLVVTSSDIDVRGIGLSGIETLKAGVASATTFKVSNPTNFANIIGSAKVDTLAVDATSFNLANTALTSVEVLQAGATTMTTFTVDQADLAAGGSVIGVAGKDDLLVAAGTVLNLTSTTLTSIEVLKAGNAGDTTFTLDQVDLVVGGSVQGNSGSDSLVVNSSSIDLTSSVLNSIEVLKAGKTTATTFIVDQLDLAANGTVQGNAAANDTLVIAGTALDLTSTTLVSVELLKAGTAGNTSFNVDQADLAAGGSIQGSAGSDTLVAHGTALDLTSTVLTSIEVLKAGVSTGTVFSVDQADLTSGGSIIGHTSGTDTLVIDGTSLDLTSTSLTSVEVLKTNSALATTFTVDQADLTSGGSVQGATGVNDTLVVTDTAIDLTSTALTSIEILKAGNTGATTLTVDQADLVAGGSVIGIAGRNDTLAVNGTGLNLTSTVLTSIEILSTNSTNAATFTVDQADLTAGGSVNGVSGKNDTLVVNGTSVDLTSTSLGSIEILTTSSTAATTFKVDQADLLAGGSISGTGNNDTLIGSGAALDLTSTALSSIEVLKAGNSAGTVFTVDQADLLNGGSVIGVTGQNDSLIINGSSLDLTSTALTSVETLGTNGTNAATFTVDQADLASGGSVIGVAGKNDTLLISGTSFDLTSTSLGSVEILQTGSTFATTFTLDQTDLQAGGSLVGGINGDTLAINGTSLDLTSTILASVETLKAGFSTGTIFTVDQADLAAAGAVVGHTSASDALVIAGTALDLTNTTLVSVEILKAGNAGATTFTVDQGDLGTGGSIQGAAANDTLIVHGAGLDLTSTVLTSIEILKAGISTGTLFTVDQADLSSGGSIIGHTSGTDTLVIHGTGLDLTSTSLTSVEILKTDSTLATTFTVDQADLAVGGSIQGTTGVNDTLIAHATSLDLTSTSLTSIDILKAGLSSDTTFTVDQSDLISGGSLIGGTGSDTLIVHSNSINLSSTTLGSIETIETASQGNSTTFAVGAGIGGATIDLSTNGKSDAVDFTSGYKASDITNDSTILAHTLTIANFHDGASNGDTIDISSLANGTPTESQDITGFIDLVEPATLKDALNIAAAGHGGTTSTVVTFGYHGDTYVLVDKSDASTLTADDAVIKLSGTHTLSDADNFAF